jgi:hypothetical protein
MTDLEYPAPRKQATASIWAVIPVALALALSIGLVGLLSLSAADYTENVAGDVVWMMFSLGAVLALLSGAVAYVVGRKRRDRQAMRMGWLRPRGSSSRFSSPSSRRR